MESIYPEHLVTALLTDIEAANNLETYINRYREGVWRTEDREYVKRLQTSIVETRTQLEKIMNNETIITGRGPFQLSELFTPRGENQLPNPYCTQCGVQVIALKQPLHTQWHNKVADL